MEQPGRRWVSSALAGEAEKEDAAGCSGALAQAEKEAECRHALEKEAECRHACPDHHSPEEEAVEEAECPNSLEEEEEEAVEEVECPDSPEEEEEAEASSSEG